MSGVGPELPFAKLDAMLSGLANAGEMSVTLGSGNAASTVALSRRMGTWLSPYFCALTDVRASSRQATSEGRGGSIFILHRRSSRVSGGDAASGPPPRRPRRQRRPVYIWGASASRPTSQLVFDGELRHSGGQNPLPRMLLDSLGAWELVLFRYRSRASCCAQVWHWH